MTNIFIESMIHDSKLARAIASNLDLPPLHSTAEKKPSSKASKNGINLKSFSGFRNITRSEGTPYSENYTKRSINDDKKEPRKVSGIEKTTVNTPILLKSQGTKTGSTKIVVPPSRKSSNPSNISGRYKSKKANLPYFSLRSDSNMTSKEGFTYKDGTEDSVTLLKRLMHKELKK